MEVTTSAANQTEYPAGQDPARWRVLIVLLTALFMSLLSVSIVNVALPSIQSGLGASNSDVQWVLSGYALTFGVILVAAGRAGDLVGRGGIFLAGIAIYSLSAAVAAILTEMRLDDATIVTALLHEALRHRYSLVAGDR